MIHFITIYYKIKIKKHRLLSGNSVYCVSEFEMSELVAITERRSNLF